MLSLATIRRRWASFVGTFTALCLGVTILCMTALVLTSAQPEAPERYAGTAVLVQSPAVDQSDGTFTENRPWSPERTRELVGQLGSVPGVSAAVPDRSFYAQVVIDGRPVDNPGGELRGHPWSSAALAPDKLTAGQAPTGGREVALDASLGLDPGDRVTLLTATGPAAYTVSGTVDSTSFYLPDAAAEALSPGVRVIGLVTDKGADPAAVASAAAKVVGKDGKVLHGDSVKDLEAKTAAKTRWIGLQILIAMASLTAFVSVFVVASTFAFSIVQRRREFGLLRTIGATPRQIRRMMYGESLTVGVAAGVAGVVLGSALAPVLGGLLVDGGLEPPGFTVRMQALPLLGSFALGLVVALAGVWSASRRAARIAPLEALREAALEKRPMTRWRWIGAIGFTGLGLLLVLVAAGSSSDEMINNALYAAMALIVGLTLFAPAVIPLVVKAVWWPLGRLSGATSMVARESSLTAVRRTASTAAPVLVTVGFAVLIAGMFQLRASGYALEETVSQEAVSVVTPHDTPGLSDAAVSDVADGASLLPTQLYAGGTDHIGAVGVSDGAIAKARDKMTVKSGSLDALKGDNTMIVRSSTAAWLGWTSGRTVPVTFEDGRTVQVKVVAEITDDSSTASVLLTREAVRAHSPSALTPVVYVSGKQRPDLPASLGAESMSTSEYASRTDAEDDRLVQIFLVILIGMSLGYTCLAIANTLMMATADRAEDFGVLRLSGATRRQVLRIVAAESALSVGIGTGLGLSIALIALLGMRSGLSSQLGTEVHLNLPWSTMLVTIGLCLALALASSVLPARMALRRTGARAAL
ncbi:ABC transporter permease [Streptomyces sp. TRM68367]|uniref:ABC transporter permease n=1 Tax=Streptomyces sp. TRM68367 TaxID=2758415 RepID=UPI00165AF9BC|nr:ABC transporter permease [Streptomyces sp. TRM68367]MBC9727075.1 ABC transporter permease [Streptomyces sp. TRM68367]